MKLSIISSKACIHFYFLLLTMMILTLSSLSLATSTNARQTSKKMFQFGDFFTVNSKAGQNLLSSARLVENSARFLENSADDDNNDQSNAFLAEYSIKYLGCASVSQWNNDNGNEDEKISNEHLVRFRLCLSCSNSKASGCNAKYGDYVIDMNTFTYYYLKAKNELNELICENYPDDWKQYGGTGCDNDNDFDATEYAMCALYGDEYYVGPYCEEQGGEIYLGKFTDETCATFSSCFGSCNTNSIVSSDCVLCSNNLVFNQVDNDNNGESQSYDYYYYDSPRDVCMNIYDSSGKCETNMQYVDNPTESSCSFIEGIKRLKDDGVIRSKRRRNTLASLTIGVFTGTSVLLGLYVYYLRTKLDRARHNLLD